MCYVFVAEFDWLTFICISPLPVQKSTTKTTMLPQIILDLGQQTSTYCHFAAVVQSWGRLSSGRNVRDINFSPSLHLAGAPVRKSLADPLLQPSLLSSYGTAQQGGSACSEL